MSPTKRMTVALKHHVVPLLQASGFVGTFPRFRRRGTQGLHFVLFAYDKAGTALFLEFGVHPFGAKRTSWGETVQEDKLMLEHVPFMERARLQARVGGGSLPDQWFHFGHFQEDDDPYAALAITLGDLLGQIEDWFGCGTAGPNISRNAGPGSAQIGDLRRA